MDATATAAAAARGPYRSQTLALSSSCRRQRHSRSFYKNAHTNKTSYLKKNKSLLYKIELPLKLGGLWFEM